jgi:hypothetical protein
MVDRERFSVFRVDHLNPKVWPPMPYDQEHICIARVTEMAKHQPRNQKKQMTVIFF